MKNNLALTKTMGMASFFLAFLLSFTTFAQLPGGIIWDNAVGCQEAVFEFDLDFTIGKEKKCLKFCETSTVDYTLLGGNPSQWAQVDFIPSGGTLLGSTTTQATIKWGNTGWGSLSIIIKLLDGTIYQKEICVEKIPKPRALFNIAPALNHPSNYDPGDITVCMDETIYFQNFSLTNGGSAIIDHQWTIKGPNGIDYLSDFEPSYVFTQSGHYYVTLTVTNECNCSSSIELLFIVEEEGIKIECNSIVCENAMETYTATTRNGEPVKCGEYRWTAIGGTILSQHDASVNVQWDNVDGDGFGYLTFVPGEGCDIACYQPTTIKVPVIKTDININGPIEICQGQQIRYSIPRWPTTEVEWHVQGPNAQLAMSDQKNEIILQANTPGTYYLTADYTNTLLGCGGTSTQEITVIPVVTIQGNKKLCAGDQGSYFLSNNGYANWTVKGPQHYTYSYYGSTLNTSFPHTGSYAISVEGDFCIEEAFLVQVTAYPPTPTAIDGPAEICLDTPITFTVPSPPTGATPNWDIENGVIINGKNNTTVTALFTANPTGPYKIKVRYEREGCASAWYEKTVQEIQVGFQISGPSTACSSTYGSYSVNEQGADKYTWTISPNYLGSVVDTDHTDQVDILWNNVTAPTIATVKAEVEKCGQIVTETFQVTVQMAPNITITGPQTVCREEMASFGLQVPGGLSSWDAIEWDFGDGNTAVNTAATSHTYTTPSTGPLNYVVTVKVTKPNGCHGESTASFPITVLPAPVGSIGPTSAAFCSLTDLQNNPPNFFLTINTNYPYNPSVNIKWFRNGILMSSPPFTGGVFTPTDEGIYHAVITGGNCETKTNSVRVRIKDCNGGGNNPGCSFSGQITSVTSQLIGCGLVEYTATYTGTPLNYNWSGEGTFINPTPTSVQVQYATPGLKEVKYSATYSGMDGNNQPCSTTLLQTADIQVPYIADISYSVSCSTTPGKYDLTLFDTSSIVAGNTIQNLEFFLDNVSLGTGTNGQVTVQVSPGQHTISLEIAAAGSFPCTASDTIDLVPMPTASIVAPLAACAGKPVSFSAQVNDPDLSYEWDFGDNAENSLPDPVRVFSSTGSTMITLTVTNRYGCKTVDTHYIDIQESDMKGLITPNPPSDCVGETIILTYQADPGTTTPSVYHWSLNGNPLPGNSPSFAATQPGEYVVDGESSAGCTAKRIASFTLAFLDTPVANIVGPQEVCAKSTFSLVSTSKNNGHSYFWTRNGQPLGQFNDQKTISVQENVPGTVTYGLTITSPTGCSDSDQFTVTVNPTPDAPSVNMTLVDCDPYTVLLEAQANESGTFNWSDGQSGATIEVHKGGPYRVIFTNNYGCSSSFEVDVPFDPNAYIWVHPTGCYETCEALNSNFYLSGPVLPFNYWEWAVDGSAVATGSGLVNDQYFTGDGDYTLFLSGLCDVQSPPMSWTMLEECRDCEIHDFMIERITPQMDAYGNCFYYIDLFIDNPYPTLSYNLQNVSGNGAIVPGGGVLPPGPSGIQLEFYPDPGLAAGGGSIQLLFTGYRYEEGRLIKCYLELWVTIPPCTTSPPMRATMPLAISVAPNPTTGQSTLYYQSSRMDPDAVYSLSLYDLTGRLLNEKVLKGGSDQWQMDLYDYADGVYLAVLRKDGAVEGHKRIRLQR